MIPSKSIPKGLSLDEKSTKCTSYTTDEKVEVTTITREHEPVKIKKIKR